jgi:uncharacterized protein
MVHQFTIHQTNMALDVNSGALHVLDDCAARVLSCYNQNGSVNIDKLNNLKKQFGKKCVEEAQSELEYLKGQGLLFTKDDYEGASIGSETVVKALCLHIAHDCNLACKYCFAGEGSYHGQNSLMPLEVGVKAIDFVIDNSGNRRNLEIDFFGGEPLLNMETVKGIVNYARKREKESNKHFRFTITTNGLLLNEEIMKYLNETMDNIVLSLDGRKEIHDRARVRKDGSGSYDLVLPKLKKMASMRQGKDYYVRGTFTADNLDFSKDVLHMAEIGFEQISIEPVVLPEGSDMEIRNEHLNTIFAEYEKLASELLELKKKKCGVNFFHFMIDFEGGPCVAKRLRGCGSGTEYLAVTPQGDLYPCHQFVGLKEFRLGSVYTKIERQDIVNSFKRLNVYTKNECKECWVKFFCSGGCAANAWTFQKDLAGNYEIGCQLQRKRVECALWLKAMELIGK